MKTQSREEKEVLRVMNASFAWAATKDRALFEETFTHDEDFFTFYPDSKNTVIGWRMFEKFLDAWMDPRNVAKGFSIRDARITVSRSGDVAWFSAIVDDSGEYDGKPWASKDVRWTGVLEKRGGAWRIVQQHMSEASDVVAARTLR
jgi:ketosteroid isomerase-like protein